MLGLSEQEVKEMRIGMATTVFKLGFIFGLGYITAEIFVWTAKSLFQLGLEHLNYIVIGGGSLF